MKIAPAGAHDDDLAHHDPSHPIRTQVRHIAPAPGHESVGIGRAAIRNDEQAGPKASKR
jgi:hypothetical protein